MALIPRASRFIKGAKDYLINENLYDVGGYLAFTCSPMPIANKAGIVFYHRYIASLKLGRWLKPSENVHHKDENKRNNHWNNLEILTRAEHTHWHNFHGLIPNKKAYYNRCLTCNKKFVYKHIKQEFCSAECAAEFRREMFISKEDLIKLLKHYNLTSIARLLEVSINTVRNWCEKYNIY